MSRSTTRTRLLVLAPLALVVGMGGTATAAAMITGAQIQDGSIYSRDIANDTLTGADVKDKSLTPTDFTGSVVGPQGPTGPSGPSGPAGLAGVTYVEKQGTVPIDPNKYTEYTASCPAGRRALNGGASSTDPPPGCSRQLPRTAVSAGPRGCATKSSSPLTGYAWVVCART